ncbi:MAG: preprotein translocase subunit SecG [Eubacteriales bacterium]|jgi:preprotein translocase subunit SecG|nr:preprotein translocase subunit SecG [Eubacteriales bacterium]
MLKTVLMIILGIVSVILIVSVLAQSSNSDGLSGSIAGGAEQLFGKKKSQGYEVILRRISIVTSVIFVAASIIVVYLEAHSA